MFRLWIWNRLAMREIWHWMFREMPSMWKCSVSLLPVLPAFLNSVTDSHPYVTHMSSVYIFNNLTYFLSFWQGDIFINLIGNHFYHSEKGDTLSFWHGDIWPKGTCFLLIRGVWDSLTCRTDLYWSLAFWQGDILSLWRGRHFIILTGKYFYHSDREIFLSFS